MCSKNSTESWHWQGEYSCKRALNQHIENKKRVCRKSVSAHSLFRTVTMQEQKHSPNSSVFRHIIRFYLLTLRSKGFCRKNKKFQKTFKDLSNKRKKWTFRKL